MSILYISEYTELPTALYANYRPMAPEPTIRDQTLAIGGTSVSTTFTTFTNFVRLHCDTICSVSFSNSSATATATVLSKRLAQNQTEYFSVQPGGSVAVIANT